MQNLQEERLRLQALNAQYLQRVTQAENRQQSVQTNAEDFARSVSAELCVAPAELVQRTNRDALAEYLQVNPGDLLINMEDLEGLVLALQKEVSNQRNDNIVQWRQAILTDESVPAGTDQAGEEVNPPAGAHGLFNEETSQARLTTSLDILDAELTELVRAKDALAEDKRRL